MYILCFIIKIYNKYMDINICLIIGIYNKDFKIENQKLHFLTKIYKIRNKRVGMQNHLFN